jgi:hypothetical protein
MGGIHMTLKDDLKLLEKAVERPNPYERYHLMENPFPGYGEERSDVCTNQQQIKRAFVDILRDFGSGAKRLRINGESGAGKTNILRYFENLTEEARLLGFIGAVYPIYIFAPGDNYFVIHEQIVERLSEIFLGDLVIALRTTSDLVDTLQEEVRSASELMAVLKSAIFQPGLLFDFYEDRRLDTFVRWLKGQKLLAQDKKLLDGPVPEINSASLAIRFLDGLLQVLERLGLCDGLVLLFDEFEEIFEALTRTRHSRYAQDLRHLFDTLQESVFFVVATTPEPRDLGQYPAIVRRLGNPLRLQPIDNEELAIDYILDYLRVGHERYFEIRGQEPDPDILNALEPLTPEIISQEYRALEEEARQANLDVLPGYFLPKMRQRIQNIVEGN